MSQHDKQLTRGALLRACGTETAAALSRHPLMSRFTSGPMCRIHLSALLEQASRSMSLAVTLETLERVYDHDARSFWGHSRCDATDGAAPRGVTALLLLSHAGLAHLLAGTLDFNDPQAEALCAPDARPAAIYVWLIFAPGPVSAALFALFEEMNHAPYAGVDIYSRPATEAGRRLTRQFGFAAVTAPGGAHDLHVLRRTPQAAHASPHAAEPSPPTVRPQFVAVHVARSLDDIMRAVAIRAVVYMAEQDCPYEEEFDGNDLTATHLIAHLGSEPAGCLRLRWFGDFAKIERVAVRKTFRQTRVAIRLVNSALELCRRKGYRQVYGQVQERLVGFWRRFGAKPMPNRKTFTFSDHTYVEMRIDLAPGEDAIAMAGDPHIFNRPEGDWDRPGILERSAARGVNAALHTPRRGTARNDQGQPLQP